MRRPRVRFEGETVTTTTDEDAPEVQGASSLTQFNFRDGFPWWLVIMVGIIVWMVVLVLSSGEYQEAFEEIIPGIWTTLRLTVGGFLASMVLGLLLGIMRVSKRPVVNTPATVYIEFIRGVPMIVFVFAIALMIIPLAIDGLNAVFDAEWRTRSVSFVVRGWIALSLFYAAFIAEVVRAGIQSVPLGQIEAGKALGLPGSQIMRRITLPQAIRNTLPALGNDLIALMKDTSLVSVIAASELTYRARIYQGSSFRVRETFFMLMVIYVTLTLVLSLALRALEARMASTTKLTRTQSLLAKAGGAVFLGLIVGLFLPAWGVSAVWTLIAMAVVSVLMFVAFNMFSR